MLKAIHFKNWRNLRDAEITFDTPITVLIGANSSGKTNILDAIRFRRDMVNYSIVQAVSGLGWEKIATDALTLDQNWTDVELQFTHKLPVPAEQITETHTFRFEGRTIPFGLRYQLREGDAVVHEDDTFRELPLRPGWIETRAYTPLPDEEVRRTRASEIGQDLTDMIRRRWQIFAEHFSPPTRFSHRETASLYQMEPDARNTLLILEFMQQAYPDLYDKLIADLAWLLDHVTGAALQRSREGDLELRLSEGLRTAPTISAGTTRLIAMLAAVYALDMPMSQETSYGHDVERLSPDLPSLVVIEEPDTALNPWIIRRFVEQLRYYVGGEHPRQFILTTHNPTLLNYFEPEEVRIVSRDDNGDAHINLIPNYIKDIWLDEFKLGEVWLTNAFGGLPT